MAYSTGGNRTLTVTRPDGSYSVTAYLNGRVTSVTEKNSGGTQVGKTDFAYDAHGHQYKSTDARNGATTLTFNNADLVYTSTTPAPGTGQPAQTTTTLYDWAQRPYSVTQPDGGVVTTEYNTMGLVSRIYGTRVYPVQYVYDAQGRMTNMTTWRDYSHSSGAATTTWEFSSTRGWLTRKLYEGQSSGVEYAYYPSGRLYTRKWLRVGTSSTRILTSYFYGTNNPSAHGDLTDITYSNDPQSTPAVAFTYDRRGRKASVSSSADAITYSYNDADQVTQDTHGTGELNGFNVTYGFNSYLQMTSLGANLATTLSQSFSYDTAGRLSVVTDGSYTSTYAYTSNSRLPSSLTHKESTTARLTTTYAYDFLNRLLEIKHAPGATGELPSYFKYTYNNANQRTSVTMGDGSYWEYGYDSLGQVTSGKRFWADGTPVAGQQFEYNFDTIGNRTSTKAGGDQNGRNLQTSTYTPGPLNQYTNRTVPAVAPVLGIGSVGATVTVNTASVYRKGEYFWKELGVTNTSASVWMPLTNTATSGTNSTTVTGNEYIAQTPEAFSYDLDGNQTQDGRWVYSWDAENRLVKMVSATGNGPQQMLVFKYDPMGRRVRKTVYPNTSGTGTPTIDTRFLFNGWLLLAELDALNSNAILKTYLWGNDLSGTRQGAGGVAGLIASKTSAGTAHFAACDITGNIARLVDGTSGQVSGLYEYDGFGQSIRVSGTYGLSNSFRSSTKYFETESGLVYYGTRFYSSTWGCWLSRDPLAERGSKNLRGFVANRATMAVDPIGLSDIPALAVPIEEAEEIEELGSGIAVEIELAELGWFAAIYLAGEAAVQLNELGLLQRENAQDEERLIAEENYLSELQETDRPITTNLPVAESETCRKCNVEWMVWKRGGNAEHDMFTKRIFHPDFEMLVTTPEGFTTVFDGGSSYPGPVTDAYEAKTRRYWSALPWKQWSLRQRAIFGKDFLQFTKQALIAKRCGLEYHIIFNNVVAKQGYDIHLPGFSPYYEVR